MFGAVNAAVVRPRPSLPWQVAQPPPIMPPMPPPPIMPPPAAGASSVSRGEVIFQTGRDASGAVIPRNGSAAGGGMMGGGGMGGMMGGGCATCHGSDGRGRTTAAFTAPNITYANLTDPQGMLMPDGSRGPAYSDAAIRTAVITGVDPSEAHLEAPMPQWQLTYQQWADLLSYLKTLQ